jgi:hypothetical protein
LSNSDIEEYVKNLENEVKNIKDEIFRISWYMRGGVTSTDLFYLYSYEDRQIISKIIKDNIDASIKAKMPLI